MGNTHIPSRKFTGSSTNVEAVGTASIDYLNDDINELVIMLDPNSTHKNGDRGGIHKGNLMTDAEGNNISGILTDETEVIEADLIGNVTGNISGSAGEVTTSIKGQAITDIFEEDPENPGEILPKVKEATHAENANEAILAITATKMDGVRIRGSVNGLQSNAGGNVIQFNYVSHDPKNKFDTTNYRAIPGKGVYLVSAKVNTTNSSSLTDIQLRVNGQIKSSGIKDTRDSNIHRFFILDLVVLTNDSDYIDFQMAGSGGSIEGATSFSYFNIIQIA